MRVIAEVEGQPGTGRTVNVTFQAPSSTWPLTVAEPVMPTGLTVVTGPYQDAAGREYRGGDYDVIVNKPRVVFRGSHFSYLSVQYPATDVWLLNCEAGPMGQGVHPAIASGFQANQAQRVVVFGGRFHGMHQGTAQDHTEGLQFGGCTVAWIKGVLFDDNHVMNLFLRSWVPAPVRYIVIEDCVLKDTAAVGGPAFNSVQVSSDADTTKVTDVVIRNNLTNMPIAVDQSAVRVTVSNNLPITAANLAAREQRLASWRAQYGLPAQTISP